MREIKFRAWDKEPKRMIYLKTVHDSLMFYQDGNASYYNLQNGSGGEEYELMQYTGLKDKNGRDVYEGDLLKSPYLEHSWTVEWNNEGACFELPHGVNECEIIGNIYENH